MKAFLFLLFIINYVFALLDLVYQDNLPAKMKHEFGYLLFRQYSRMLGGLPNPTDSAFNKFKYVVFSLFIVIVNMNILIAIISDTYANVLAKREVADTKGKADILQEFGGFVRYFNDNK